MLLARCLSVLACPEVLLPLESVVAEKVFLEVLERTLLDRLAGEQAAAALSAPFVLGDRDELEALFEAAGAADVSIETRQGTARFPGVRPMVEAEVKSTSRRTIRRGRRFPA